MTRQKRENLWWPKRAAAFMAALLVVAAFTTPNVLRADGDASSAPNSRVTVRCNQPHAVAGLPLRVLVSDSGHADLLPIEGTHTFNASGEAVVSLAPGVYSFEVAAVRDDGTIVALHSNSVSVPKLTTAKIVAGEPKPLTLSHDGREVELSEVGVRSAASTGQVRWRRNAPTASPKLILTPGQSTRINVIGSDGPLHVAAWEKVTANTDGTAIQLRTQSKWNNCRFTQRAGTPQLRSVTAVLVFPDSRMEIPVTDATRVLTNRRFVMMGYRVELADGKCLEFEPLPCNVNNRQRFELGGAELTPRAWADYVPEVTSDEDGRQRRQHLFWRYDLLDTGGHCLNVHARGCDAEGKAIRLDGKPIPNGWVDERGQATMDDPTRTVRVRVQWT